MRVRRSSAKIVLPIVGVAILLLGLGVLAAKTVFDEAAKKAADRKADKQSTRDLIEAANEISAGKPISAKQFPDTPIGHMNKLIYDLALHEQTRTEKFNSGLEEIGWDWVMTDESLKTKANLQECLARIGKAKKIVSAYSEDLEKDLADLLAAMEVEASKSDDADAYYKGFKRRINEPHVGFYFAREMIRQVRINHRALEGAVRYLLAHRDSYEVTKDGLIFYADVPQSEIDQYNAFIKKAAEAGNKIEALDKERLRVGRAAFDRLGERLKD